MTGEKSEANKRFSEWEAQSKYLGANKGWGTSLEPFPGSATGSLQFKSMRSDSCMPVSCQNEKVTEAAAMGQLRKFFPTYPSHDTMF